MNNQRIRHIWRIIFLFVQHERTLMGVSPLPIRPLRDTLVPRFLLYSIGVNSILLTFECPQNHFPKFFPNSKICIIRQKAVLLHRILKPNHYD